MICSNCGTRHSCGCKAKTASDGKKVCSSCFMKYEATLNKKGTPIQIKPDTGNTAPTINNITYKQGH